jgi:O-antigen ligase
MWFGRRPYRWRTLMHYLPDQNFWQILRSPDLLKLAVIVSVLGLALILGREISLTLLLLVLLAIGGALVFAILSKHIEWGILAIIPISFFARWEIGTGTNVSFNLTIIMVMFLLGLWILQMVVLNKNVSLAPSQVNLPALIFIVAITLSTVAGNVNWNPWITEKASLPAQAGGWMLYALSIGLMLLVGNRLRELRWLQSMTWLFLGLGWLYFLTFFVPVGSIFTASSTGAMFWIWMAALAFGQLLFNHEIQRKWRFAIALMLVVQLVVSLAWGRKEWLSGWVPALIACGVILWLRSWRWALAVIAIVGVFVLVFYVALSSEVMTTTQEYSYSSRLAAWTILFELIKTSPFLGLGPSNYYHYTWLYSFWGWHVKFNSHNNYIDIVAQTGLVGFIVFTWLIIAIASLAWRLHRLVPRGFSLAYVNAVLGGLAGMLVAGFLGDWFLPFLYNIGISGFRASVFAWLFLGGLLSLEQIYKGRHPRPKEADSPLVPDSA